MATNARERLEDILSEREYQVYEEESQGFFQSFLTTIENWINEQLENLFSSFGVAGGGAAFGFFIIIIVVVALLAVILLTIRRRGKRQQLARNEKPFNIRHEKDWTYHNHLDESFKYEQNEAYTLASRHLFLALLLYFHDIDWLEAKSWKTNWEYYDELRSSDREGADFFYKFVQLFDHITYGEREVQQEEYNDYRRQTMTWISERARHHDSEQEG